MNSVIQKMFSRNSDQNLPSAMGDIFGFFPSFDGSKSEALSWLYTTELFFEDCNIESDALKFLLVHSHITKGALSWLSNLQHKEYVSTWELFLDEFTVKYDLLEYRSLFGNSWKISHAFLPRKVEIQGAESKLLVQSTSIANFVVHVPAKTVDTVLPTFKPNNISNGELGCDKAASYLALKNTDLNATPNKLDSYMLMKERKVIMDLGLPHHQPHLINTNKNGCSLQRHFKNGIAEYIPQVKRENVIQVLEPFIINEELSTRLFDPGGGIRGAHCFIPYHVNNLNRCLQYKGQDKSLLMGAAVVSPKLAWVGDRELKNVSSLNQDISTRMHSIKKDIVIAIPSVILSIGSAFMVQDMTSKWWKEVFVRMLNCMMGFHLSSLGYGSFSLMYNMWIFITYQKSAATQVATDDAKGASGSTKNTTIVPLNVLKQLVIFVIYNAVGMVCANSVGKRLLSGISAFNFDLATGMSDLLVYGIPNFMTHKVCMSKNIKQGIMQLSLVRYKLQSGATAVCVYENVVTRYSTCEAVKLCYSATLMGQTFDEIHIAVVVLTLAALDIHTTQMWWHVNILDNLYKEVVTRTHFVNEWLEWALSASNQKGDGKGWKVFVYASEGIMDNRSALKMTNLISANSISGLVFDPGGVAFNGVAKSLRTLSSMSPMLYMFLVMVDKQLNFPAS